MAAGRPGAVDAVGPLDRLPRIPGTPRLLRLLSLVDGLFDDGTAVVGIRRPDAVAVQVELVEHVLIQLIGVTHGRVAGGQEDPHPARAGSESMRMALTNRVSGTARMVPSAPMTVDQNSRHRNVASC